MLKIHFITKNTNCIEVQLSEFFKKPNLWYSNMYIFINTLNNKIIHLKHEKVRLYFLKTAT